MDEKLRRLNALISYMNWEDVLVKAGYFDRPNYSVAHTLAGNNWRQFRPGPNEVKR